MGEYQKAKEKGLYIEQDTLASWLRSTFEKERTAVLDCRDVEDHHGGRIASSWHTPDESFDGKVQLSRLLESKKTRAVFHCMESARRGPRCALKLLAEMDSKSSSPPLDVYVLKGGADLWLRHFMTEDPSLISALIMITGVGMEMGRMVHHVHLTTTAVVVCLVMVTSSTTVPQTNQQQNGVVPVEM